MPGTIPAVEIVMWRMPSSRIFGSFSISTAPKAASALRKGSPIPISTRLLIGLPMWRSIAMNCPAISPFVRFRSKPDAPVWQNGQPTGQPACVETHAVSLSPCFSSAVSTCVPSRIASKNFLVPSFARSSREICGLEKSRRAASSSRSGLPKSVISDGSQTPLFHSHAHIRAAR